MRSPIGLVVVWLAAGCAGSAAVVAPAPLARSSDSAEYASFAGIGGLAVSGQAFLTMAEGEVRLAAGRPVTLDPATTFARRWFGRLGADVVRFQAPAMHQEFNAARRMTVADAEGRFWFSGLRPGTYLLRSTVSWKSDADSVAQGGVVAGLVTVVEGAPNEVILHQLYTADSAAILTVAIVGDAERTGRRSRSLGRISGSSCDTEWEEPARKDLVLEAGRKGADAVVGVGCRKRGFGLMRGCLSQVVCEGEGVVWM